MKTQVWVYVVVAALSLGAGVAIAGVPRAVDRAPTIEPPSSPPATTATTTTTAVPSPESSEDGGDEDVAPVDDETVVTDAPVETTTTTTTTLPPVERDTLEVAVANGASVGGAATDGANALEEAGYAGVGTYDGSEIRELTVVFAIDGMQSEAERLAEEIGIGLDLIFPIDTSPDVGSSIEDVELLVYLGRDVVDLSFFN